MKRERRQNKHETECTPFGDIRWFCAFIVSDEYEIGAYEKIFLVWTEFRTRIENAEHH